MTTTPTTTQTESNQCTAGREWMKKAQDRLNSFSWFNRKGKYEDAAEMFVKAANIFKMDKKCTFIHYLIVLHII
jgi:hypothetical protein